MESSLEKVERRFFCDENKGLIEIITFYFNRMGTDLLKTLLTQQIT